MKKFIIVLLLSIAVINPTYLYSHELIPKELKIYLLEHPDATPEEIKKYADEQVPEFSEKFKNGAEIIKIVQNQDTSFFDNFFDFLKLGFMHILGGLDHVLFVLSLILVFISWKDILKITATFTVAHSITLLLAGTGILTLSSNIVEPIIALSIAYVAITSVFFRNTKFIGENNGKIVAVFFFGLFHGLGFAGLLQEIQIPTDKFVSSLLAFNLGIEAGQLLIVSLVFPLIYFFKDKTWYQKVVKIFAVIIVLFAVFWFFQRLFLI